MPTYEYQCDACGHEFELFQSMTAPVKRKCPKCGKAKLQRLIGTGAGIIFKGGGFYQTDYRSEGYKKAAEADKKSTEPTKADSSSSSSTSSDTASAKDAKSDTKPAADSNTKT
jgi:putative FmdB family regulatory protein